MAFLTLSDGRRLAYEDYGRGPLILLLHGSPGTAKAWQRVGEALVDRFRIVAPDLPGHGASDAPARAGESPGVADAAGDIEALIRSVGTPVVLAGHSYGGVVALAVAMRAQVAVRGLALFEPVALTLLRSVGDVDTYAAAKSVFDDYIASHEAGVDRAVATMVDFWFSPGEFERMPSAAQQYMVRETGRNVADVRATFALDCRVDSLRHLAMPVLAVQGGSSPDVTARIVAALAAHTPRGSRVRLEGATHAMTTTHAAEVASLIAAHAAHCGVDIG